LITNQPKLSILVPLLNEEESLTLLTEWIDRVITEHNYTCELLFIDDGSTDDSWSIIQELSVKYPYIKAVKFLRNYGKSAALNVGFDRALGEIIVEVYGEMHRYIPVIAKNSGFTKIGEKVVSHQARQFGVTKFGYSRFINGFLDLLSISFIGKFGKRPMHFFGAIGILSTVIGMAILGYLAFCKLVMQASNIDDRPLFFLGILLVIVGVQLFIAGFLAELIIRNSQERNNYKVEDTIDVA